MALVVHDVRLRERLDLHQRQHALALHPLQPLRDLLQVLLQLHRLLLRDRLLHLPQSLLIQHLVLLQDLVQARRDQ